MPQKDWRSKNHSHSIRLIEITEVKGKKTKKKKTTKKLHTCRALECRLCYSRYSFDDIMKGTYNIETMICSFCYATMQRKPHNESCFGKPTFVLPNGKRLLGYDPEAKECSSVCPDREICKRVVIPEIIPDQV